MFRHLKSHHHIALGVLFVFALAAGFYVAPDEYADAASAVGTAHIDVVAPLEITGIQNMHFGSFTAPVRSPGMVYLDPAGVYTRGIEHLGGHQFAEFTVSGDPSIGTVIENSREAYVCHNDNPSSCLTAYPSTSGNGISLSDSGTATVRPVYELYVPVNQAPGTYSGTYSIEVHYDY